MVLRISELQFGECQKDPADRIIVATARVYNCPLMTIDRNILAYPHVRLISVQ